MVESVVIGDAAGLDERLGLSADLDLGGRLLHFVKDDHAPQVRRGTLLGGRLALVDLNVWHPLVAVSRQLVLWRGCRPERKCGASFSEYELPR